MKFINRLGYYLGGFAIGLVILAFILSGKKASCAYGPNARTVKNISSKPIIYSTSAQAKIQAALIDSTTIVNLIKFGDVDFSKSIVNEDSCNTYFIRNSYKERELELSVRNCTEEAIITDLLFQ